MTESLQTSALRPCCAVETSDHLRGSTRFLGPAAGTPWDLALRRMGSDFCLQRPACSVETLPLGTLDLRSAHVRSPQNHCYQSKKYLHQSQNVQTLTLQNSKGTNSVNTNQAKPGIHGELCMFRGRCQSNVTSSKARCLQIFRLPLQRLCYLLGSAAWSETLPDGCKTKDFSWIMDCPKWVNADHAN